MRPQDLSPLAASTEGGLWVGQYEHEAGPRRDRQHHHHQQQQLQHHQQPAPDFSAQHGQAPPARSPLCDDRHEQRSQHHLHQLPGPDAASNSSTADLFVLVPHNVNSSCSDLTSPLTPTFSHHGGSHLRYASSTSSLDLQQSFSSASSDCPVSPTSQPPAQNPLAASPAPGAASCNGSKRQLPDVQEEEPLEREQDDAHPMVRLTDDQLDSLYDCLCMPSSLEPAQSCLPSAGLTSSPPTGDSPCDHHTSDMMVHSVDWTHSVDNDLSHFDYDMGFVSDGDAEAALQFSKQRSGAESPLTGLTMRLGTRFPTLSRWRSTKRRNRAFTAVSEPSLDLPPPLSRATSTSRSSSLSAPGRKFYDRAAEPPLPPTPALSFYEYESTESVASAVAIDIDQPAVRESIERERALSTTPLLPPLLTEAPSISSISQSQQPSPLQSPTVAPQLTPEIQSPASYATPPLSTKPSFSSFRPPLLTSLSTPVVATSDVVVTIPNLLEQHDAWSDRLGHANYTILPRPYHPVAVDLDTLRTLRADWDLARVSYTKHIVRTREHYGATSKTFALTEAKWAETEREWKSAHESLVARVAASNLATEDQLRWDRLQDGAPTTVPTVVVAKDKFPNLKVKFPDLGDEDIVGPMVRDAVMAREPGSDGENGAKKLWKSLAGKVGLRK